MRPGTLQLSASLCEALLGEETEMVEVLLKRGADPNLLLPEGIAAIHLAAGTEQESGVRCLGLILQYGGDPNVRVANLQVGPGDLQESLLICIARVANLQVCGRSDPLTRSSLLGVLHLLKTVAHGRGDPSLEDQDGKRPIDLARDQGNEMCVCILQHFPEDPSQGQSPWMSHRRAESFLSTDTEHSSEIGTLLSEDESQPAWLDRTLEENFEDAGPGSSVHHLVAAAPSGHPRNCNPEDEACCFGDSPSASWLTEDSQQHGALHSHCHPCARLVAPSSTLLSRNNIPGNRAPSLSTIRVPDDESSCPKSEVPISTPQVPCFKTTIGERRRSSLDPAATQNGISPDFSVDSHLGTPKLNSDVSNTMGPRGNHQVPPVSALQDGCEVGVFEMEDIDATFNLSQYKSFLDPDLVVKITGQEGLDVTSPDHAYLFCQLNSTAKLDLEKTVVDVAFLASTCEKPDGCPAERKSFSESSDGYASCNSEQSFLEVPCCNNAQKYEERKAGLVSSPCSLNSAQRNSLLSQVSHDPHFGPSKCSSGEHTNTPSVPAAGRYVALPTKSEGTRHLCDKSHLREAFSKICAGKKSLDLQNTGQSECLGNIVKTNLSQMSQEDLLPTENWDFCTLPLRESQRLTVADDAGEEDTAPLEVLASVTGKQDTIAQLQGGLHRAPSAEAWAKLNADQGRRPVLDLSRGTQDGVERGGDSWAKDTILIQGESEETQPLPVGESSVPPTDNTVAVSHDTLKNGEDETPELDVRLRMMMLSTKAHHSPLLQQDQRPCHITPRSKSRMTASANLTSSSASLFDATLGMPRRPRRVRTPNRMPPTAGEARKEDGDLRSGNLACRVEGETCSLEDTKLITGSPMSCQQGNQQQSRPSSPTTGSLGAPISSVGKIYANDPGSSREADVRLGIDHHASLEVKPPLRETMSLPREEEEDGTAREGVDTVASCVEPGKSGEKHGSTKKLPRPSRVSFSRISSSGPSGVPGRFSPLPERLSPSPESYNQDIPLSPGGRPVNLSTRELVEYLYVDEDKGHALVERHVPNMDHSLASTASSEDTIIYDWRAYTKSQVAGQSDKENSPLRVLPNLGHLSDDTLVRKLRDFGVNPGMVTGLTRMAYMQLLEKLMSDPKSKVRKGSSGYTPELSSALDTYQIPDGKDDEMTLSRQFDQPDKNRKWREGLLKSSFNYLLLDPRVTQNLPFRSQYVSQAECFRSFISAIFYVGKGKRSRPYCHLYEALAHYKESRRKQGAKACPKVQHILEIWASGEGVISMHCFQNVIPVEAYTHEASMVDAIGLKMLTNQKRGNYYGVVAGWPMKRRRRLGIYLLHRAMQIFLAEGERQLRPTDIRTGQ